MHRPPAGLVPRGLSYSAKRFDRSGHCSQSPAFADSLETAGKSNAGKEKVQTPWKITDPPG